MGSRGAETGAKLWKKIENRSHQYASDHWKAYKQLIPKDQHVCTKAETYTVEGMNNCLRHYLARFHRKTHGYSKSLKMIHLSILSFVNKDLALQLLS